MKSRLVLYFYSRCASFEIDSRRINDTSSGVREEEQTHTFLTGVFTGNFDPLEFSTTVLPNSDFSILMLLGMTSFSFSNDCLASIFFAMAPFLSSRLEFFFFGLKNDVIMIHVSLLAVPDDCVGQQQYFHSSLSE